VGDVQTAETVEEREDRFCRIKMEESSPSSSFLIGGGKMKATSQSYPKTATRGRKGGEECGASRKQTNRGKKRAGGFIRD